MLCAPPRRGEVGEDLRTKSVGPEACQSGEGRPGLVGRGVIRRFIDSHNPADRDACLRSVRIRHCPLFRRNIRDQASP